MSCRSCMVPRPVAMGIAIALATLGQATSKAANYFVSTAGSDTNSGFAAQPAVNITSDNAFTSRMASISRARLG